MTIFTAPSCMRAKAKMPSIMLTSFLVIIATVLHFTSAASPEMVRQRPSSSGHTSTSRRTSNLRANATRTSAAPKPRFPVPSATTGPKDPCGPVIQDALDPTIPDDTCTADIIYSPSPVTYGASLYNDGSGLNINYDNCDPVVLEVCASITDPRTPVGVWNWTGAGSQCTMGFWLPEYSGAAPRSTTEQCQNQIFRPMLDIGMKKGGKAYNQVVVNLRLLPDDLQTGLQVSIGYPSYTITHLPLITRNQTSSSA